MATPTSPAQSPCTHLHVVRSIKRRQRGRTSFVHHWFRDRALAVVLRIPAHARALACTRFLTSSLVEKRLRSWALIRRAQQARELCRFGHLGARLWRHRSFGQPAAIPAGNTNPWSWDLRDSSLQRRGQTLVMSELVGEPFELAHHRLSGPDGIRRGACCRPGWCTVGGRRALAGSAPTAAALPAGTRSGGSGRCRS